MDEKENNLDADYQEKIDNLEEKFSNVNEKLDLILDTSIGQQQDDLDEEWLDPEEKERKQKARYERDYIQTVKGFSKGLDEDDRNELLDELADRHNVFHTGVGVKDAELNIRRAQEGIRQRNDSELDDHAKSFLNYLARDRGKTERETRKWARKTLKAPTPASLEMDINYQLRKK